MIRRSHKAKSHSPLYLIIIGMLVLMMWMMSCKTLQNTPGYGSYDKNTDWKVGSHR